MRIKANGIAINYQVDGPERAPLTARARELGLERRVHFSGLVLDAAEPLGLIDLYLTVAVGPTIGIAALEATLFGLPVLAVQLLADYRPRPQDWIWSSADPAKVADRAIELLSDHALLRALAERQREHALAIHSVEAMGNAYERLYNDARARRRERFGSSWAREAL